MKPLFALLLLLTTPLVSLACSCMMVSINKDYQDSDVVIDGVVLSEEIITIIDSAAVNRLATHLHRTFAETFAITGNYTSRSYRRLTLVVRDVFKGTTVKKGHLVTITTDVDEAACGVEMAISNRYIVFAYTGSAVLTTTLNGYWTNLCTHTGMYSEGTANVLRTLRSSAQKE